MGGRERHLLMQLSATRERNKVLRDPKIRPVGSAQGSGKKNRTIDDIRIRS